MSNVTLDYATRERLRLLVSEERRRRARAAEAKKALRECPAPNCGRHFEPRASHQRYCSPKCQSRAQSAATYQRRLGGIELPVSVCDECGGVFQARRYGQRFCSKQHRERARERTPEMLAKRAEYARKRRAMRKATA